MTKTLQPIGNSLGLIIDKPILSLLGITASTPLEITVTTDGKGLLIRPISEEDHEDHKARVKAAADRVTQTHRETLKKLAES
jgi:antitoxin component of MazEF toxin-antitoxin module